VATPRELGEMVSNRDPRAILLVENEPALRDLMRRFLEGCGYAVLPARNGDEALAVANEYNGPIELLLTDVVMPGMSGFVLADTLVGRWANMKVVYFSGYADDYDVIRHGLDAGGRPFLLKPFTQKDLQQKIVEVLGATPAVA
jgi:two-component system cell cycle sensor histidine kinase/response regulator CckA